MPSLMPNIHTPYTIQGTMIRHPEITRFSSNAHIPQEKKHKNIKLQNSIINGHPYL